MQQARFCRRWRTTNEDASSFASKVPTIAEPTNDGVLDLITQSTYIPKKIKLFPILLGADNDASSMRIIGWHRILQDGKITLWKPTVIGEFVVTASAEVGVAGAAVLNTERFCDTIAPVAARTRDKKIAAGTSVESDYEILSPTNDLGAHIIMPLSAFEKFELTSDQTTGTATFNCIYCFLDE